MTRNRNDNPLDNPLKIFPGPLNAPTNPPTTLSTLSDAVINILMIVLSRTHIHTKRVVIKTTQKIITMSRIIPMACSNSDMVDRFVLKHTCFQRFTQQIHLLKTTDTAQF